MAGWVNPPMADVSTLRSGLSPALRYHSSTPTQPMIVKFSRQKNCLHHNPPPHPSPLGPSPHTRYLHSSLPLANARFVVSGYHQPGNPALEKIASAYTQDKNFQQESRRRDSVFYWVGNAESAESVHQPSRSGLEEHGKMNTDAYQKTHYW